MSDKKQLDEFIEDYKLSSNDKISFVSAKDLSQLKSLGHTSEDLFNHLNKYYKTLLHGSRIDISNNYLKQNEFGEVYCSNLASIALMKAIISNRGLKFPGLQYPYFIDVEHPFEVKIHGINDKTIGQKGFVYVVNQNNIFENYPKKSWQYVNKTQHVSIIAKIAIEKSDFTYPIFDVTNNKRIQ